MMSSEQNRSHGSQPALYWLELPVNNLQRTKQNPMQTHRYTNSPLQQIKKLKSLFLKIFIKNYIAQ